MKNEELILHIDTKFDEINNKINDINVKLSRYWSNTIFQYILLLFCFILFIVFDVRFTSSTSRVDNLYDKISTQTNINLNNSNENSNSARTNKTSNTTNNSKKIGF